MDGDNASNEDNPNDCTDDETNGNEDIECVVGSTREKDTCRLAEVNDICFCDVRTKGQEMVAKANPKRK